LALEIHVAQLICGGELRVGKRAHARARAATHLGALDELSRAPRVQQERREGSSLW